MELPVHNTTQVHTPPASAITERTPPVTIKEHAMCTRDPGSGGAQGVDGRYNTWRAGAPGPHAHGNEVRQVVDNRRAEVCGQRKSSNDARNNQHSPGTPTTGLRKRGNDASRSTGRSSQQNAATQRNMRREERVTVQGQCAQGIRHPEGQPCSSTSLFACAQGTQHPVGHQWGP